MRTNNEDSLLVVDRVISEEDLQSCKYKSVGGDSFVLAVADGMGGHAKGEVASKLVLETLRRFGPPKNEEEVIEVFESARRELEKYVEAHPEAFGMGCAVAGIVVNGDKGIAFNIGDCRVYRFINGKLVKLTRDHSTVEELVLDGVITPEEARIHPQRNILTSAVIGDGYSTEMKVFTVSVDMKTRGKFLVCSDGLWDELEDKELEECMSADEPCKELIELLKTKPLKDNVSFIILL